MLSIIYVHVGAKNAAYINMLRISAASVRKQMKEADIIILSDKETAGFLTESGYFDDDKLTVVAVDVPSSYTDVEKSRYLKTNLRRLVSGDFLYIDSDTVVCADVLDTTPPSSVCMVLDENCPLSETDDGGDAIRRAAKERGIPIDSCERYFNSGVIMSKDDETARRFFEEWFETWDRTRLPKKHQDQFSLNYVNSKTDVIYELDGKWNFQITESCRDFGYLRNVIVLHYLSPHPNGLYKLNDIDFIGKELSGSEINEIIDSPEKQFVPLHSYADSSDEYRLMQQSHFHLIYRMYTRHRRFYDFTDKLLSKLRK